MENDNPNLNKKNDNWWRPVLFFYIKTTSWIIFPLVIGILGGQYVSKSVGSQVIFFVFVILGFLITCLGIYREIKQYKKTLTKNEPK
jgi:F0F1-type ATP synthase assembly protein I